MANEIQLIHDDGAETVYAIVRDMAGNWYHGTNPEAFDDANWGDYDIALVEVHACASGNVAVQATFPAVAAGFYWIDVYVQAGANPAQTDYRVCSCLMYWDAAALVPAGGAADMREVSGTVQTAGDIIAAIGGIGSGTGAALNFAPDDDNVDGTITNAPTFDPAAPFVGVQTSGTFASASADDGTYHQIDDNTNELDIIYQFNVGSGRNCAKVVFTGYMGTGTGDTVLIKAYNFLTGAWDTRGMLVGQINSVDKVQDITLLSAHTGTSTLAGKVYIRFDSTATNQVLYVDSLIAQAQNLGQTVGYADGAIWIGSAASGVTNANTTPYVDGTADNPCTYAASKTLAASLGLTRFHVRNGSSITLDASAANKSFVGKNWTLALGGQAIGGAYIEGATISGTSTGDSTRFLDCSFTGTCTLAAATFKHCGFDGTVTLTASKNYSLVRCYDSNSSTAVQPVFVFAGNNNLGARDWTGGIEIGSFAATDYATLDGAGRLVIGSTCSANPSGTITIRGPWAASTDNVVGGFKGTITQTQRFSTDQTYLANATQINGSAPAASKLASAFLGTGAVDDVDFVVRNFHVLSDTDHAARFESDCTNKAGMRCTGTYYGQYITGNDGDILLGGTQSIVDNFGGNVMQTAAAAALAAYDSNGGVAKQASVGAIATILTGITSLANWLRGLYRNDTINSTALSEINSGGGAYSATTDSNEALADKTGGLTAQQTRDALKLAPSTGTPEPGSVDAELDALSTIKNITIEHSSWSN